jgi:hypothetical protein
MQEVSRSGFVISELHKMATNGDIPPAVKVRALELMGKTVALFTDRVETEDTTDRSAEEIEAQIKARLGLPETAGGAGKKGGGYTALPKQGRWGCSGPLSASVSVSRSRCRSGCQCRVQCRGRMHGVMGCRGGSDRIGGAGGSTGKRHPVDPTHPHPPDRSMPHQKYLTWYSTHTITPFPQLILKPTPPPILNSKIDEGGHRKRHPPFLRGA